MDSSDLSELTAMLRAGDGELDLALAALLVARQEYPDLDVSGYLGRLDAMAAELREALGGETAPLQVMLQLNRYLFEELGFRGNDDEYYDPRNSFLNEVLDRRTGIPLSLSLVYMEVGRRLGLPVEGISFPGHFLVKVPLEEGEVVLDPYHRGVSLSLEDLELRARHVFDSPRTLLEALPTLLEAAPKRDILRRMVSNLKAIYAQGPDHPRLLAVIDLLIALSPEDASLYRERARCYEGVGHVRGALEDYRRALALDPEAADAPEIRGRIQSLGGLPPRLH